MKTIWKFPLEVIDDQLVAMPCGAEVLTVQTQAGVPCLWALVDPNQPSESQAFETFGTGHPMSTDAERKYVGTYQLHDGSLVFHVFEAR